MITRQVVGEKLLGYLNKQIMLAELVEWAENCMVTGGFGPDEDVDILVDIVMYLAAADTAGFPLTWDVCSDFMEQLGIPVKVVPISA